MNRRIDTAILAGLSLLNMVLPVNSLTQKGETQAAEVAHQALFASPPGGYSPISVKNKSVIAAAKFAVLEQSKKGKAIKLSSITTAYSQIVAGTNYQLELKVEEAGVARQATVTVYEDLKQVLSLTDWTWK
jgi:hypothetical protein